MIPVQSNDSTRSSLPSQNRFRPRGANWGISIGLLGMATLFLAGCGESLSSSSSGGSGSSGSWSGPAYSAYLGTVTVNSSNCLVFPASLTVISFDAGIAATARVTVSGSLNAADGWMMILAYGTAANNVNGSYRSTFAIDGVIPGVGENVLALWHSVGFQLTTNTPSIGGFTAFTSGDSFASWVTDFDKGAESADSWWPDTTPTGSGDVTSTGGMGTPPGTSAHVEGFSATLCSYAVS